MKLNDIPYIFRVMAAIALLFLGIVGILVPVMQGWIFIGLGIYVLSPAKGKTMIEKVRIKWSHAKERISTKLSHIGSVIRRYRKKR